MEGRKWTQEELEILAQKALADGYMCADDTVSEEDIAEMEGEFDPSDGVSYEELLGLDACEAALKEYYEKKAKNNP